MHNCDGMMSHLYACASEKMLFPHAMGQSSDRSFVLACSNWFTSAPTCHVRLCRHAHPFLCPCRACVFMSPGHRPMAGLGQGSWWNVPCE